MSKGIYQIKNKINEKVYVGSACNIQKRWMRHKSILYRNMHYNKYLQHAWNKYGANNFEFTILVEVNDNSMLSEIEQEYLNRLNPYPPNGYNMSHDTVAPMRGMKHSKIFRKRRSNAMTGEKNHRYGKHPSEETLKKMSETQKRLGNIPPSQKGMKFSDEHRKNMSEARKGMKFSENHRRNLSKSHAGQRPWIQGKHHTKKTCKKMSESQYRYRRNKEQVDKIWSEKFMYYGGIFQ